MAQITVKEYVDTQTGATLSARIASAVTHLFPSTMGFPENMTQADFLKKLLTSYYNYRFCREEEDLDFWSLEATGFIENLLEKYKPLYESALFEFEPLYNVALNATATGTNTESNMTATERSGSSSVADNAINESNREYNDEGQDSRAELTQSVRNDEKTANSTNLKKRSDTPQGSIDDVLNGHYLSEVEQDTANASENSSGDEEDTKTAEGYQQKEGSENSRETSDRTQTRTDIGSDNTTEAKSGSTSNTTATTGYTGASASKLLQEYRETLLTITSAFLRDCATLFNLVWKVDI